MGPQIQLSDFVGEHGSYQLTLTFVLFIRYVLVGLMANSGPLMTPDVTFYCSLPMDEVLAIMPNISRLSRAEQELEIREEFKQVCKLNLHLYLDSNATQKPLDKLGHVSTGNALGLTKSLNSTAMIRECEDFTYDIAPDQGRTMTGEFDLVCERESLRSIFQSLLSASIVCAHIFWGTFSDKYGRYQAQRLCILISLVSGFLSIFAADFWSFVVARSLCSFGDLGLVVSLTTVMVELVGSRYRGLSVAIANFGFALGVTILPYIVAYLEDFRQVIALTVLCHVCTIPFLLASNESVRWLTTNRRYNSAKRELKRIVKFNQRLQLFYARHQFSWTPDQHEQEHAHSHKISDLEERQAFELLFNKFVEQSESQNYQEYLNSTKNEPIEPEPQSIVVTADAPSTDDPSATKIQVVSPEQDDARGDIAEAGDGKMPDEPEPAGDSRRSSKVSVVVEVPKQEVNQQVQVPGKRANSLHVESVLHPSLVAALKDNTRNRTLTLPTLSRCPSREVDLFALDIEREYKDVIPRSKHPDQQPDCINLVAHQLSFMGRVSRLFKDKQLMLTVFTLVWTTFNSELQYTSYIIINLEAGEDVYLNYVLGGCMELLAAVVASLLLSYARRRHSLIAFWLMISLSCFGLSVAHIDSHWAVWLLALAKFSQSSLSTIAGVAAYESFPTSLRQSGSGLVSTLGMMGSVFAPLIFAEFDDQAGMDRVLMTFSLSSLTGAILIYKYLKETRDCELQ